MFCLRFVIIFHTDKDRGQIMQPFAHYERPNWSEPIKNMDLVRYVSHRNVFGFIFLVKL